MKNKLLTQFVIVYSKIGTTGARIEYFDNRNDALNRYAVLKSMPLVMVASMFAVEHVVSFDKDLIPDYATGKQTVREVFRHGNQEHKRDNTD